MDQNLAKFKNCNLKVGLLGGSFDPAHEGHLFITLEAIKRFQLDYVWWIVTPQNPTKKGPKYYSLEERVKLAQELTKNHQKIIVSTLEKDCKKCYTYNTVKKLINSYPDLKFVWIMGADNLQSFSSWYRWQDLSQLLPIIVFDRYPYSYSCLNNKASVALKNSMVEEKKFNINGVKKAQWTLVRAKLIKISSTKIREKLNKTGAR